ncbi:4-amino-4-deoxy-L-arabinose-phospho-UDP flippase [Candidatus Sodalis endolongispinus]|uniref:Probable 4-amino-4-deoxy-L-arabinose-phosphoundecaprenol flippase subunit ArnF n=1 Tax=Candidatus Sodalis endolongispinus TaxID=2812662 RepID=A0ABS5YAD9_9GAMM|nr:4-amino-4-deoxy-L-arabinose-phosphoundecaprenol flippase subunit ArnF [Candidatus Sodalis endolongispinus]MBT9431901.1 4-amino-4-deoxy-L-arabinose-phospho-UDP flippase [Candidatus Sodalis endolongispinus]
MGYGWALFSVALVSAAQLLLKWAMMHLPPLNALRLWLDPANAGTIVLLAGGLLAYVCSIACWFMALRRLPLNKAYPLLSLSYVLVAACALMIPEFNERFTFSRLMGVALICGGLLLICLPAGGKGDMPRR